MAASRLQFPKNLTPLTPAEEVTVGEPGTYQLTLDETAPPICTVRLIVPDILLHIISNQHAGDGDAPSLTLTVEHLAPRTKAEVTAKSLVRGTGSPTFKGLLRIAEGASECESYLRHDALLIGEKARVHSWPALEILNNEVKCSHSATVRTVRSEDLAYLRSRGLLQKEAEALVIEGFLQ